MSNTFYVFSSRKVTNVMETVADRITGNRQVIQKVPCAVILAPPVAG
jgi:hypothetical protein